MRISIRPASITALTILHIIVGVVDILVGFLMLLALRAPTSFASSFVGIPSSYDFFVAPIAVAWFTFGTLAGIIAVFIWKGKGWAWLFSLVLATDALVLGGFGLLLGSLVVALPLGLYGLILIFLGLTQVRSYCGRTYPPGPLIIPPIAGARVPEQAFPPFPYAHVPFGPTNQQPYAPRPPAQSTWNTGICPSCGASLQGDASYCYRCGLHFRWY